MTKDSPLLVKAYNALKHAESWMVDGSSDQKIQDALAAIRPFILPKDR